MQQPDKKVFFVYKSAIVSILENKIILLPFLTVAFLQLLIVEILYFYPKFPLKLFFEPFISKLWSPIYMHYPNNLIFLPQFFGIINIFLYIFVSSFFICVSVHMIAAINQGQKITMGEAIKKLLSRYIHIIVAGMLISLMVLGFREGYDVIFKRALEIRSETGPRHLLKRIVVEGKPYFSLLMSIFVAAFWAYLYPLIAVDKKNIFKAVIDNFKILWRSWWFSFCVVFWPSLVVASIFILRASRLLGGNPELSTAMLVIGLVILAFTDAVIYTSLTVYFLASKESQKERG